MSQLARWDQAGFDHGARLYDRVRPEYPEAALGILMESGVVLEKAVVLDIGCGTGKLIRLLKQGGAVVAGLDISLAMLQVARGGSETILVRGRAERLPFRAESFSVVTCGQGFQWFDHETAAREFRRVLTRWGKLLLMWNVRQRADRMSRDIEAVVEGYRRDAPRHWEGVDWARKIARIRGFGEPVVREIRWRRTVEPAFLIDLIMSRSYIARQSNREQGTIRSLLSRIVREYVSTAGGSLVLRYVCRMVITEVE